MISKSQVKKAVKEHFKNLSLKEMFIERK